MDKIYMEESDYEIENKSKLENIKKLIIEFGEGDNCDRKSLLNSIKKIVFDI
jgi:hypothetical protein